MKQKKRINARLAKRKKLTQEVLQLPEMEMTTIKFESLHIGLIYEIFRLKKRLKEMEDETNVTSLLKAIERMEILLSDYKYEVIDYIGQEYDERVLFDSPRFVISNEVISDKGIITKVIYPQINYDGKVIKLARVEISKKGES